MQVPGGSGGGRRGAFAAMAVAAVVLAACSGGPGANGPPSSTPSARPSSTAKLAIVSPEAGSVVSGSTVRVVVSLQDATIVPATSSNIRPDQGHLHLYLDGQIVSMNYQKDATIPDVSPGQHVLRVEFVASDHAPFDPRDFVQVTFTVQS
jgi:hypothetical protein